MSASEEAGLPEASSERKSVDMQQTESHPGRAYVPEDRKPKGNVCID